MLHYYLNLCDGNEDRARAVKVIAEDQFRQFEQYLRNSITALENKQVEANWEPFETPNLAKLQIIGGLYQYNRQTEIRITGNQRGHYRIKLLKGNPNFSKKVDYQIGDTEGEFAITEDEYEKGLVYIEGIETDAFDALRWGFADIELTPAWFTIKTNEMLRDSKGGNHKIITVNNDDITVEGFLQLDEKLYYGDMEIHFTVPKEVKLPFQNVDIKQENDTSIVFYSRKVLGGETPVGITRINGQVKNVLDFSNIFFEADPRERLQFEREEDSDGLSILLQNKSDYGKTVVSNKIYLKITEPKYNDMDSHKIRLKDPNTNDDEENALSPLRYFFDDDVTIVEKINKKSKYYVELSGCKEDENIIVLRRDATKEERARKEYIQFCRPPLGSILRVQVDTRQLKRQLAAVSILKQMPHKNHEMLIRLFESREKVRWSKPPLNDVVNEWFVLKDERRSGCIEQRRFINKALNTPDFAILEGPPGSGKTTAILELICQLVSQKKRVLLCGSTNVAIDNIFERLIEKDKNGVSLLERIDILPVRIGNPERVELNIADYRIDKLIGECSTEDERNLKQRLLLDAANLVCGTTMGIVNHPKFYEQVGNVYGLSYDGNSPVIPEFDYLIIDESSKTTFQEFLVPALYAKRCILAGDVMQLSPFTDRESVEFNFEQVTLKNSSGKFEALDTNIQQAVFFLNTIKARLYWKNREKNTEGNNRFIYPCSSELLEKIVQELASGRIGLFTDKELFIFITKNEIGITEKESGQPWQHGQILLRTSEEVNYLELTAANVILVDSSIFEQIIGRLPETHAVLQKKDWETMPHAFYHNASRQKGKFGYFDREFIFNSFEIVDKINEDMKGLEQRWAQEISWRIDSEHQLRLVDKSRRREKLGGEIDELTPCSVKKSDFEEARNMIAAISFPSILESLTFGIKGKKPRVPSTISEGFYPDVLEERKTTLTFQHRMHPDISIFPRQQYYKDANALLDLEAPKHIREAREWDYDRYKERSIWVNVQSQARGSRNIDEVKAMMQHLKYFLDYAVKHPQPEGKKWEVACLAFYKPQEKLIREGQYNIHGLQSITENYRSISNFHYNKDKAKGPYEVFIRLHSVDRFQGHEADVVFLSMSRTDKDGFLDNPNRLNVSITRAKFQLLIFGKHEYFSKYSRSLDLRALALAHENFIEWR